MPKRGQIKTVTRKFDWGEMEVIELGEKGRGRKLSLIPYQQRSLAPLSVRKCLPTFNSSTSSSL